MIYTHKKISFWRKKLILEQKRLTNRTSHIAQNVSGTFSEPSVKTKETSKLKLSDG